MLIEKISGINLEDYLRKYITGPLQIFGLSYAQNEDAVIKVKTEKGIGEVIADGQKARAARETAAAARAAAMSEGSSDIKTPLTVDLYNYEAIAIVDATFAYPSGAQVANKSSYNMMSESFSNSPLTIINPTKYDKKKFRKNKKFLRDVKNPKWLYIYFKKSIQGVDEIRSLVVRNHQNRIIYNITTTNISADETISALVDF